MSAAYLPILVQAILAACITGGIIAASTFLGQRAKPNKIKDTAYECGVSEGGIVHSRFSVKFFIVALLFMLFDLEVVILIPWTFIYRKFLSLHVPIFWPIFFFFGVLALGLYYEKKKGALEWEK